MRISQVVSLLIFKVPGNAHKIHSVFLYSCSVYFASHISGQKLIQFWSVYTRIYKGDQYIQVIRCGQFVAFHIPYIPHIPNSNKQVCKNDIATVFINHVLNHERETCVDYRINYKHVMASLLKSFKPLWVPYPLSLSKSCFSHL